MPVHLHLHPVHPAVVKVHHLLPLPLLHHQYLFQVPAHLAAQVKVFLHHRLLHHPAVHQLHFHHLLKVQVVKAVPVILRPAQAAVHPV